MLHLISGKSDDRKSYVKKIADEFKAVPQHIHAGDIDEERSISDLVVTQTGLFGDKEIYVIHDMARDLDLKALLSGYAGSENIIVFSEATVTKKITGAFEKVEASIHDFGKEIVSKEEKMNIFTLADALGNRDKKQLWLLLQQALQQASPEEIHGILFWQVKNMMMVATSETNPGLNNFVYTKNQGFVNKWTLQELHKLSSDFVRMFHKRDSYRTLDIDLEKVVLSL